MFISIIPVDVITPINISVTMTNRQIIRAMVKLVHKFYWSALLNENKS